MSTGRSSTWGRLRATSRCRSPLANDHLTGVGFDLPEVAPVFEDYVVHSGVQDRLRFAAGDFFADDLPQADVVVMGHILHDWSLEEKQTLIRKAHEALPAGGALIVYESIIDDDRSENAFGLLMSLNMLIETEHGFRLHRRGLHGLDDRGRIQHDACRTPDRTGLDGHRREIARRAAGAPKHPDR